MTDKIVVFCAHPDDEVLGAGGTIAKYSLEMKKVHTVIFSFGEQSHAWLNAKYIAKVRERESRQAHKILGGTSITFLGLKEGNFKLDFESVKSQIIQLLLKENPSKIFVHSPEDPHPDHRAVFDIMVKLVEELRVKSDIYSFDVWNPINIRKRSAPRLYVDISNTFKIKKKALRCFKSQRMAMTVLLGGVYWKSFMNGLHVDTKYAESFIKIK